MARDPPQTDVHLPFFQSGLDVGRRDFQNTEIDPGMFLVEAAKQCRHQGHIQIWDDPNPEGSFDLAGSTAELLQRLFDLTQNRPGVLLKTQTRRGERDAFAPR